ncbi:hypothetical protein AAGG74_16295 [Bacillus mexicanus]|uniref:hypothetical protein n=1 Tax=Bacillus mexicanus TaxID=2834415 RepID=UPI003D1CB8DA
MTFFDYLHNYNYEDTSDLVNKMKMEGKTEKEIEETIDNLCEKYEEECIINGQEAIFN